MHYCSSESQVIKGWFCRSLTSGHHNMFRYTMVIELREFNKKKKNMVKMGYNFGKIKEIIGVQRYGENTNTLYTVSCDYYKWMMGLSKKCMKQASILVRITVCTCAISIHTCTWTVHVSWVCRDTPTPHCVTLVKGTCTIQRPRGIVWALISSASEIRIQIRATWLRAIWLVHSNRACAVVSMTRPPSWKILKKSMKSCPNLAIQVKIVSHAIGKKASTDFRGAQVGLVLKRARGMWAMYVFAQRSFFTESGRMYSRAEDSATTSTSPISRTSQAKSVFTLPSWFYVDKYGSIRKYYARARTVG